MAKIDVRESLWVHHVFFFERLMVVLRDGGHHAFFQERMHGVTAIPCLLY